MGNAIDVTGKRFGYLIVKERLPRYKGYDTYYKCECDCGKEVVVRGANLTTGHSKSCGCQSRNMTNIANTKHKMTKSQIYRVWSDMKNRTKKGAYNNKGNYKKLNIQVCKEWKDNFISFYNWAIINGYTEEKTATHRNKLTLDRIDSHGNYCPENCRWITMKEQASNRTGNIYIEFNGKTQSLPKWAEELNIPYRLLYSRYKDLGWDMERILKTPVQVHNKKEE